jgi:predicted RNA binding protein YcfA (HicA-like mRNA interferase family)
MRVVSLAIGHMCTYLQSAGRKAKGSHTVWKHPALPGVTVTISGQDGKDARPYLVDEVQDALKKLERK